MLDFCFDIVDGVIACFTRNLSWSAVISTYWFLFVVEFPRYYFMALHSGAGKRKGKWQK